MNNLPSSPDSGEKGISELGRFATRSALALLVASAISATQAYAADDQAAPAAGTLEEIVVTAQRRSEVASDVPITITSVSEEQLADANVNSVMGLPKVTPGLRIDQQGSYTQPTIRGIGTSVVQTGSGSSVGIYVDGYYMPTSLGSDLKFMNIKSVQVLKGPQGTLFGRNTPGGAILIETARPSAETRTILEASAERFNAQKYQGYFTTGVTDDVAVSIEGRYSRGDGFVDNIYDGGTDDGGGFAPGADPTDPGAYENWAVRASAQYDISDKASLLLRYAHSNTDDPTAIVTSVYKDKSTGTLYSPGDAIPGTVIAVDRGDVSNNAATYFKLKTDTVQLTGNFDLGFAELTTYTQYREEKVKQEIDSDNSSAAVFALGLPEENRILSQEVLLNSNNEGPLQYTTGLFLYKQVIDAGVLIPFVNGYVFPYSATGVDIRTYAVFTDATYQLRDDLFLTAGIRYSRDEVNNPYYQTIPGVPGGRTYQDEYSDGEVTPRIVIRYKPTENTNLYASYTEGYKSAIYDPRATSGDDYLKPENVKAWEVGFKYAGDAMTASVAPFYYEYQDLQNAYYRSGETIMSNAAESTIKGIEGELRLQVTDSLQVSAAASYVDAKYDEYKNAGYFQSVFTETGAFAGFNTTSTDASGNQMQRSPKTSGNLSARYITPLAEGDLTLSSNLYFTSKFYFDPAHQFEQDAYELLAARAEWTDGSGRYTVALYGDNLTDEKYFTQANGTLFGAGTIWGAPRTFGVSLRVDM